MPVVARHVGGGARPFYLVIYQATHPLKAVMQGDRV